MRNYDNWRYLFNEFWFKKKTFFIWSKITTLHLKFLFIFTCESIECVSLHKSRRPIFISCTNVIHCFDNILCVIQEWIQNIRASSFQLTWAFELISLFNYIFSHKSQLKTVFYCNLIVSLLIIVDKIHFVFRNSI